ncbi:NKAIN4 isoform 7, partial [Pongo abelii]
VWVTWNIFIICFYLEVGGLLQDSELLTFSLSRHRSWWREHWPGCLHEEVPAVGLGAPHGQALVSGAGCALEPSYVEALHSGLQILIANPRWLASQRRRNPWWLLAGVGWGQSFWALSVAAMWSACLRRKRTALISLVDLIHFLSTMSMKSHPASCPSRRTSPQARPH